MKTAEILLLISTGFSALAQTWTQTLAPTNGWSGVAMSADGSKIVAVAGGGSTTGPIYTSTNFGGTWISNNAPVLDWVAVSSSADGTRLAANAFSRSGTWTNSGTTWKQSPCPLNNFYPSSIASSADGNTLLVGGGPVSLSTNRGNTWTTIPPPPPASTGASGEGMAMSANGTVMLVNGQPYLSTNSGTSWFVATNLQTEMRAAAASVDGVKLFALGDAGVWVSTNAGRIWAKSGAPTSAYGSIAASADGVHLVLARRESNQPIYLSADSGWTWTAASAPSNAWVAVASSADGNLLAAAINGGGIWLGRNTPSPQLTLQPAGTQFLMSWTTPSTNFILQGSADLSGWTDLTNTPVLNLTNLQAQVPLPGSGSNTFYRLKTP